HTTHLAANIRFINFHDASQKFTVNLAHGRSDAVAQIPSRLVSNAKRSLHLKRAHSFFRFCYEIDRQNPFPERKVSVVKDCARRYGKLVTALVTVVLVAIYYARDAFRLTARTSHTFRPPKLCQPSAAFLIVAKLLNQFRQIHFSFEGFSRFFHKYA